MMTICRKLLCVFFVFLAPIALADSYFDGETPLLCSVYQLFECDPPNGCVTVTPEAIQAFGHLNIDFKQRTITKPGAVEGQRTTIEHIKRNIDGKLILQGIENGRPDERDGAGWSISIMDPEGTMVVAIAADGFSVTGLGACVPKP